MLREIRLYFKNIAEPLVIKCDPSDYAPMIDNLHNAMATAEILRINSPTVAGVKCLVLGSELRAVL